ncbi:MAG: segregation and condensation protein A, partial [Fidelibacterota bacterium]
MAYRVKLENFEGPLDLLLFFIHRDKINIYDIPIAYITKEFVEYLDLMQKLNIEIAGEFIYMASTLMRLKAKMLIPRNQDAADEFEDPRTELVQRLLEYKQFREASETLTDKFESHSFHSTRGMNFPIRGVKEATNEYVKNISLFDLLSAFKSIIENLPKPTTYKIEQERIFIGEQIQFIREQFKLKKTIQFTKLIAALTSKLQVIVTFMAILELLKLKEILL